MTTEKFVQAATPYLPEMCAEKDLYSHKLIIKGVRQTIQSIKQADRKLN